MLDLRIYKRDYNVNEDALLVFCEYVMRKLKYELYADIDWVKINEIGDKLKIDNLCDILLTCIDKYLILKSTSNYYYICFDNNAKLNIGSPEFIVRQITYGSLDVKGYSGFRDVFEIVEQDLGRLYKEWLNGN